MPQAEGTAQELEREAGPFPLSTLRHSVAHLMASAVERLYPGVRFGFGPAIEHGFYYDFDLEHPLDEHDLERIEQEMRRIAKAGPELVCHEVTREEARERLRGQPYKLEQLESLEGRVRKALEAPGEGRVLVIDGGGSLRCALVGDQLAELGVRNGWAGIIVYGCIRDAKAIGGMDLAVFALGTHPKKTVKRNSGEVDIAVSFGGVTFVPGHYLYADDDGVIVSASPLL